jgi:WD40 repeat protein
MSNYDDSLFICDFSGCKKYFKEPINLSCGDMICKEHLSCLGTSFKCPVCAKEILISEERFGFNTTINTILNRNYHLKGQHRKAKEMLDELEKEIDVFEKTYSNDPIICIKEYISKITEKIDRHRDQMIASIHERSEEALKKLDEVKAECNENKSNLEKVNLKQDYQVEMDILSEMLRETNLHENELNEVNDNIKKKFNEIKPKSKRFEKRILANKSIWFEPKHSKAFGELEIENLLDLTIDNESGVLIRKFEGFLDLVLCIEQIEGASKIITCSEDSTIKIWSTESGECLKTLTGHTHLVRCVIISNDKKYLISGSHDLTIKIWNIENDSECVQTLQQKSGVNTMCLMPNNLLVCALIDCTIIKINFNNFTQLDSFKAHESAVHGLKHVSLYQIVSCSWEDYNIKLWDLETNECLRTFIGHTNLVNCLETSHDKSKLYSGSFDLTLIVWDISTGDCLEIINFNYPVVCLKLLSHSFLAVGLSIADDELKIIDLYSFEIVKSIETNSETIINFISDEKVLFTGSERRSITMWQF